MAQVLAVPGDVRHGFSYIGQFNHDFGRITGIASTIKGNILVCDYDKKNLILVDHHGNYLKKLDLDSEPYDVAITTVPNTGRDFSRKAPCLLGLIDGGYMYAGAVNCEKFSFSNILSNALEIGSRVVKFQTVDADSCLSCIGGQNYILYKERWENQQKIYDITTMDTPTDICSDNNGHMYVSGQESNNIHRLAEDRKRSNISLRMESDWKVLDIPLDSHHGIKKPVALCFNQDYSRLYIVNDWGKSVLVFDVI
ncbi:unnamed protein product [Mytilus coruscus]|uniref:Tripartite motif-containing protein 2 n=1 Tax=Mytilus coruscus TaxID=42192 RepID=A0A6J8CYR3_MYTCO|nr:unnamed protein product [Mytilus coruscus]